MIKKLLYGFAVIAGLASCHDDYTDWSSPQSNAANEAVGKLTLTVQASVSSIDFATESAESIQLFTTNLQEGQTDKYTVTISAADRTETAVITANAEGAVAATDLQNAVATIYGKAPTERTLSVEVSADVTVTTDDGAVTTGKTGEPFTLKVTLDAPQISAHYYLIGAPSSWGLDETSLPFSHSGNDVYDDPVFTCTFPVEEDAVTEDGNIWFAIIDDVTIEQNDWSYVFGCAEGNGANGMEGKLNRRTELGDDGSWAVNVDDGAKYIRVTINMMEYSYQIEKINFAEYIYEVGNNNNWGNDGHPTYALQCPNSDGIYHGAMYLTSGFKFRSNPSDWNGEGNWGMNADKEEGILFNDGGSSDISLAEDGFYKIVVDLASMTYTLTPFTQLGIIGDGQPGGWDNDTPLTYDATEHCWTATDVVLTGGKTIKFRTINDWNTVNIGGSSLNNLVFNSNDNIPLTESGTFTVKLYLETQGKSYATLTAQ